MMSRRFPFAHQCTKVALQHPHLSFRGQLKDIKYFRQNRAADGLAQIREMLSDQPLQESIPRSRWITAESIDAVSEDEGELTRRPAQK
jgi:hypothetical protein